MPAVIQSDSLSSPCYSRPGNCAASLKSFGVFFAATQGPMRLSKKASMVTYCITPDGNMRSRGTQHEGELEGSITNDADQEADPEAEPPQN